MIGIYKFTNKLTGESYIGQSQDIHKRYLQHQNRHSNETLKHEDTYFHLMLRHYGFWNFEFEVLEECLKKDLDNRERYYIEKFKTEYPNGYNKTSGGNSAHAQKIDSVILYEIIDDLRNSELNESQLASKYGVHLNTISQINLGKSWHDDEIDYPIRKHGAHSQDKLRYDSSSGKHICPLCGRIKERKAKTCLSCYRKIGSLFIPDADALSIDLNSMSFEDVARKYSVSSNTVRKWCKKYMMPYHASDYGIKTA